ncbi:MAG TPA: hypothetical protein PKK18_10835 [Chitinophagales bacterium]|nr:hypothetical protein [Chitinophagales bacterium]HMX61100.1 hypothetical protein [Chitinophagales bacterium]HMY23522.1 hypothetical protein [Chitinophagales bacterium]HMZ33584.1 hypothetical protein [Chitinophagales bacterium]HNC71622.1 hypothetical protein [Chitinophagales bacterium]
MKYLQRISIHDKDTFAKVVFAYYILLLLFRWHSSAFLTNIFAQPLQSPGADNAFWLSHIIGFPQYIIQHYWASLLLDISLVVFAIACFFMATKKPVVCIVFIIIYITHRITLESYACSHTKSMAAIFMAFLPFCCSKERNFYLTFEFSRYFLLYIMVASAFFKVYNGMALQPNLFATTLINQHIDVAINQPTNFSYQIASILIKYPIIAGISYTALVIVQAFFIIGFFTKKIDNILFILLLCFTISTYLLMRIYNFDIIILGLFLLFSSYNKKHEH